MAGWAQVPNKQVMESFQTQVSNFSVRLAVDSFEGTISKDKVPKEKLTKSVQTQVSNFSVRLAVDNLEGKISKEKFLKKSA